MSSECVRGAYLRLTERARGYRRKLRWELGRVAAVIKDAINAFTLVATQGDRIPRPLRVGWVRAGARAGWLPGTMLLLCVLTPLLATRTAGHRVLSRSLRDVLLRARLLPLLALPRGRGARDPDAQRQRADCHCED